MSARSGPTRFCKYPLIRLKKYVTVMNSTKTNLNGFFKNDAYPPSESYEVISLCWGLITLNGNKINNNNAPPYNQNPMAHQTAGKYNKINIRNITFLSIYIIVLNCLQKYILP